MGFDIECVIDIQNCPGEYFCPVCRTLIYPHEALQAQCMHLYCKPCLTHTANTTRACPYDGYLVTEADSKPLMESNKSLAECIGKIKVHCLFHRSGCTWEGPLSECTSHCSGCPFGNSPVVCNRCGLQILHRQVHEHAQICPGVYQTQPAAGNMQDNASTGAGTESAIDQKQSTAQSGTPVPQTQNSQAPVGPVPPGPNSNLQPSASSVATAAAVATATTADQWYQQQYEQYYQQYAGYNPYQQYYPYQQQVNPQYQPQPFNLQGQPQPQVYAPPQLHNQTQVQAQPQVQVQPVPQAQAQASSYPQPQHQSQSHPQLQTTSQPQAQSLPQGQVPPTQVQALGPQHQNQAQGNPQQQLHPPMQAHAQIPSHAHPPPQGQASSVHPQAVANPHSVQAHVSQQVQMPQYQQLPSQMQHSQPAQVPHQQPLQPQLPQPPQHPQAHQQVMLQPHFQHVPQAQAQSHSQSQPRPPQLNQPANFNSQPQMLQPSANAVSGHHSYPQPQVTQFGGQQQHPPHVHQLGGSLPPTQVQGQVPQQSNFVRPAQSLAPVPNQQQDSLPSQFQASTVPTAHQQHFYNAQQTGHPFQPRPITQPSQQLGPQQHTQQPPYPGPVQGQSTQHGNFAQQLPMQSHSYPQGGHHVMQQSSNVYQQSLQNAVAVPGVQSRNLVGRAMMPNHGLQPQPSTQTPGVFAGTTPVRPMQHGQQQTIANQNYVNRPNHPNQAFPDQQYLQSEATVKPTALKSQIDPASDKSMALQPVSSAEMGANFNGDTALNTMKPEAIADDERIGNGNAGKPGKNEMLIRDDKNQFREDGTANQLVNEQSGVHSLEPGSSRKSITVASGQTKEATDNGNRENHVVKSYVGPDKDSPSVSTSSASNAYGSVINVKAEGNQHGTLAGKDLLPPFGSEPQHHSHLGASSHQQKSSVPSDMSGLPGPPANPHIGLPPTELRSQGHGNFQSKHPNDVPPAGGISDPGTTASFGRGPGHFGLQPTNVEQHAGLVGRAPRHGRQGQFDPQRSVNLMGPETFQHKKPNHFERNQLNTYPTERALYGQPSGFEQNMLRAKGVARPDSSMLGSQDKRFGPLAGEHLNPFLTEQPRHNDPGSMSVDYEASVHKGSGFHGPARFLAPQHPPGGIHSSNARDREVRSDRLGSDRERVDRAPDFLGSGPGFGRQHIDGLTPRDAEKEYHRFPPRGVGQFPYGHPSLDDVGRDVRLFGEGSRPFNLPADVVGDSFNENQFVPFPGHLRQGELDGPGTLRFGERLPPHPPGPHIHNRESGLFGPEMMHHHQKGDVLDAPHFRGHLRLGEASGFGIFPGHGNLGEGPENLPHHLPFGPNSSRFPRLSHPGFRSTLSFHGFPNDGRYGGNLDAIDKSRNRWPVSMGWCRICMVDCDTVEGLDMHSQTREHQKMAMDMVRSIKQQNRKKKRTSGEHHPHEGPNKKRNAGFEGRAQKA